MSVFSWQQPLQQAVLLRRYKRFLADVRLPDGSELTVHCPNTGAMTGCAEPGSTVWLSLSSNPKRKYQYTWELVEVGAGERACIHSALANRIVRYALDEGVITPLDGYSEIQPEARYLDGSRMDFRLAGSGPDCYVEVKSVTLAGEDGLGMFPDAVSTRASRHLETLMTIAAQGQRAVLLFAVLHTGVDRVAPADHIDPRYGETLRRAIAAGVEVLAYGAHISPEEMYLTEQLPVEVKSPASGGPAPEAPGKRSKPAKFGRGRKWRG